MKEPDPHLCVLKPKFIQLPQFYNLINLFANNPIKGGYGI